MPPTDPDVARVVARNHRSFHAPLAVAWKWNRSKDPADHRKAEELLDYLMERFPLILRVWYERAFNLVKQKRPGEAQQVLAKALEQFHRVLDEDTLSLVGRLAKDEGDEHLRAGRLAEAEQAYARAEAAYERAYALRKDRFPGIN